jgi:photosystem II stability/assembly factor-like uncharacterized protein
MADYPDRRLQRRLALLADAVPIPEFERGAPDRNRRFGSAIWRGLPVAALGIIGLVLLIEVVVGFPARVTGGQQVASVTATASSTAPHGSASASPSSLPAGSTSPSPAGSPTIVPGSSPGHLVAPGRLGFDGLLVWNQTDTGLSISRDAGRTWADVRLPDVPTSSILAVSGAPGRAMWIAAKDGSGVRLYRRPDAGGNWSSALLTPSWPTIFGVNGQPIESALLTPGPDAILTVAETIGVGNSVADTSLFVSTDDGLSFTQHQPRANSPANLYWSSVTLATAQSGVIVVGSNVPVTLLHTPDAGNTWSKALIAGLPAVDVNYFGTPVVNGTDIEVPLTSWASADNTHTNFALLTSHDGGVTFTLGALLPMGTGPGSSDTQGLITWVVDHDTDTIYQTADGGQTWSHVSANAPIHQAQIHLTGPTSAVAVFSSNRGTYLMSTTDGGLTWSNL